MKPLLLRCFLLISLGFGSGCEARRPADGSQVPVPPPQAQERPVPPDSVKRDPLAFGPVFQEFFRAIQQQDTEQFNRFIHPEYGLYIFELPGAVPHFSHVKDISRFRRHFQDQPFFSIREQMKECQLEEVEALLSLNCEGGPDNPAGYTRTGCLLTDGQAFRQNEAYRYAPQPEAEKQAVEEVLPLVQKTVLHTASTHQFHFGQINGQWYVLFIDLMVPCSA